MIAIKKTQTIALIVTIVLVSLWLIVLEIDQPRTFTTGDSLGIFLPSFVHNWRSLMENHTLPIINFHQYLGQTFLAQGETGVLYPLTYLSAGLSLLLFGNFFNTIDIFAILHWLTAAIATFFLLRQLKVNNTLSVLGALLWISFPYTTTMSMVWADDNLLLAYLPLNFLFLERFFFKPNLKTALWLTIIKSWFFFGGFAQHTIMILVLELPLMTVLIYRHIDRAQFHKAKKLLFPYTISLIIFLLTTTPLWLPMYEAKSVSALRTNQLQYSDFTRQALTFKNFTDAQLFKFHPNALFGANSYVYYIGITNLFLLSSLLIKKIRRRAHNYHIITYSALALTSYLLSTSLYGYLYNIPILNWFRGPHKYFAPFSFFLTIAIIGIATIITNQFSRIGKYIIYFILIASITTNVILIIHNKNSVWSKEAVRISKPLTPSFIPFINSSAGRALAVKNNVMRNKYHQYLMANLASLYNVNYLAGYDPLVNKINLRLAMGMNDSANYKKWLDQNTLNYLSQWSVRYLLTGNNPLNIDHFNKFTQLKLIYSNQETALYENTEALPYVYDKIKPNQVVPHEFGVNEVNIYPTNNNAHQLIITIAPLSRYVIYFDGIKHDQINPENKPIQINVPANTKQILIRYEDPLFRLGVTLFLATWLSIALIYLVNNRLHSRKFK